MNRHVFEKKKLTPSFVFCYDYVGHAVFLFINRHINQNRRILPDVSCSRFQEKEDVFFFKKSAVDSGKNSFLVKTI